MKDTSARVRRVRWWVIFLLLAIAAMIAESELSAVVLVSPAPGLVNLLGGLLGFLSGGLIADSIYRLGRAQGKSLGFRRGFGVLALPLLTLWAGAHLAQRAFVSAAFVGGVASPAGAFEATVSSSSRKRAITTFEIDPRYRPINVPVERRPSNAAIGRLCLTFLIERGRFGALRTHVPTIRDAPIQASAFRRCSPNVLARNPQIAERVARIDALTSAQANAR